MPHYLSLSIWVPILFGLVTLAVSRETTRDMVCYGLYCFAMFLGGALLAGWAMWFIKR